MATAPTDDPIDALLEGLNPPQRDAVTHGDGPLLILAGAGSGKTRVLTHRIAYLHAHRPGARGDEILAITFTNKAAQEMRERVELLVGRATRGDVGDDVPRRLRADAARRGATGSATRASSRSTTRPTRGGWSSGASTSSTSTPSASRPRAMQYQISDAKNKLRDAEDYRQLVGSYFEQTVADVYELYERELHRMNAMDFDDLLVRAVNVLELFQEVRDRYAASFRQVLVDEYQDTNHAQYRWLQLLAGEHRNLAVVGDDDQCLVEGTPVTMGDGIGEADRGRRGRRRGAVLLRQRRLPRRARDGHVRVRRADGIEIATRGGRGSSARRSTPTSRATGAAYAAAAPDVSDAARTRASASGRRAPAGPASSAIGCSARQEHADAAWVLSVHEPSRGRAAEAALAAYGLPTLPFVARRPQRNGLCTTRR